MKIITVSLSNSTYHQARVWAAQNDTTVSALIRHFLENLYDDPSYNTVADPDPLLTPPPSPPFF